MRAKGLPRRSKYAPGQVPLERAFSKLGLGSRSEARKWIEEGRVLVNGRLVRDPDFSLRPESARIQLDGELLWPAADTGTRTLIDLFLFHKPRGLVCTHRDEKGRRTIYDHLRECAPHLRFAGLHSIGRLDQATSGLLLLTHSTRLSDWMTSPQTALEREYLAQVRGQVTPEKAQSLCRGYTVDIDGYPTFLHVAQALLIRASPKASELKLILKQGKNREIRRLCLEIGHEVTALKRLRYGTFELGDLKVGELRAVSADALSEVEQMLSLRG